MDFILTALPWVIIGNAIVLIALNFSRKKHVQKGGKLQAKQIRKMRMIRKIIWP